ncbi:MAG: 16S rRNA (guanine(966)-N(2))-methyltransferase RsmD [Actinobacteria bacterium]|jgi:16S rRNA (guanine966-N2)-methyltransferase|nr:16S rRNA (guanine(966)-N(2))-methyltransferase RsmD [Actinomycetota bacterium]
MRIVAGTAGGRKLVVPQGETTRPTSERVREAIFNSLYSLDAIDGADVLDLFAGSGALGLEALSRGAAHATLVETDRNALNAIYDNVEALGFDSETRVVPGEGLSYLGRADGHDLVLLDPPYGFDEWDTLIAGISKGLAGAVVVIESDREVVMPDSWEIHRVKRYGSTVVMLATAGPSLGGK